LSRSISAYYDDYEEVQVVAADFNGFLERLLADVKAVVAQDETWTYRTWPVRSALS
jgi:hypothetical protein